MIFRRLLCLALPAFALFAAVPLRAADAAITSLSATARGNRISVAFGLKNVFDSPEIVRAIESGTETGFTYEVELYRTRPNWFDQRLARARIDVTCTFDSVRREYQLSYRRNRKLVRSETFSDLETLKQKMTHVDEADLFQTSYRPNKLHVRARATVIRDYLFYVVPWDLTTEWKEARVKRAEAPR